MTSPRFRRDSGDIPAPDASLTPNDSPAIDASPTPELVLTLPSDAVSGGLVFAVSFSRWLLAAFERVDLVADLPSPADWNSFAREFTPRGAGESALPPFDRPIPLQDNLSLYFAEDPFTAATSPVDNNRETPADWAHVPSRPQGPDRLTVRAVLADASPALTPCVERASLWVALLPAEIDAFMRFYLLVKSAQSLRRPGRKFYAVLDRGGPDHDLKKIRLAWDTVTERFLGWPIPILGQIDLGHLADEDVPAARRLRACEEALGPPWPSDLQAQCQAATAARVFDSSPDRGEADTAMVAETFHRAGTGDSG
jgi:hypothetical protein